MMRWKFDGGPNDDAWTWSCVDSHTAQVIRRSQGAFPSLGECVLDAVKQRVLEEYHCEDDL